MSSDILKNLQSVDIETADISQLKDITEIKIDDNDPPMLRILKFMEQVKNPYLFKVGNTPVKIVFSPKYSNRTIEDGLENIIKNKLK